MTNPTPPLAVPVDPLVPAPAVIQRVRRELPDTFTLTLDTAGRAEGFAFAPGQFNMLYVFGVGEVPISISGDPARPEALVHTVRAVGAVTREMQGLKRGDALGVRGPYGTSWPVQAARGHDVVVIAGGLGLAPLRPVVYHLLRHRADYGRVAVLYGARTPDDVLYRRELERWRDKLGAESVQVTVDRAPAGWPGHAGVVTSLLPAVAFDPARTVAMVCGPEVMMRFVARELARRGVPDARTFVSLERNMKCAVGLCGRCQYGPTFVCKDGPVVPFDRVAWLFNRREV